MYIEDLDCGSFILRKISALSVDEIELEAGDYEIGKNKLFRVELPSKATNVVAMEKRGFFFADRTLDVEISLKKNEIDERFIRFEVLKSPLTDEISEIAKSSFPFDSRFNVTLFSDDNVTKFLIEKYLERMTNIYVCKHKGKIVGFLDAEPCENDSLFIYLAAVEEKYRATGIASALYANAILDAKKNGLNKVCGRISSLNISVMNLYSRLGGVFGSPLDVFLSGYKN